MAVKIVLILCVQMFIMEAISTQSIGSIESHGYTASWGPASSTTATCTWGTSNSGIEWSYAPSSSLTASTGSIVAISSTSPASLPVASVLSDNSYEGILSTAALPLGTVALEGLPTGAAAIAYGCGNAVGIIAEDVGAYGFTGMVGLDCAAGSVPIAYGSGIGYGPCGYNILN